MAGSPAIKSGVPIGRSPGSRSLAILAGIAAGFFAIFAFGQGRDLDPMRPAMRIWFAIALAICLGATVWHFRRTRRADLVPDVLASLMPIESILEVGRCHLTIAARMSGSIVEIEGYAQNLNDGPGLLELTFIDRSPRPPGRRLQIPPLTCKVPPAAVVRFTGRFLCYGPVGRLYQVYLEGRYEARGRQVRFARRKVLSKRVSPAITAAALAAGTIYAGGGFFLSFTVDTDVAGSPVLPDKPRWAATAFWLPPAPGA